MSLYKCPDCGNESTFGIEGSVYLMATINGNGDVVSNEVVKVDRMDVEYHAGSIMWCEECDYGGNVMDFT